MSYKKLQIKLLSKSGELLNVVNCQAGHVTVLRANTHAELQPYQRALTGVPGPERFSINLDGQEFKAAEHVMLGFGKDFLDAKSVEDFLASYGVPRTALKSVLMSYGLDQYAKEKVGSIGECPQRRVQLLAATYTPDKVLVLNNPFQPLSNEWKDAFAELILTFAKNKSAIVIVTSLTFRPQSWIGNELIARVQVGSTLQKTIGFGSDQEAMREMLEQVRASTSKPATAPAQETPHTAAPRAAATQEVVSSGEFVKRASQSWMGIAFVLCTLSMGLGAGGLWYLKSSRENELAKIIVPQASEEAPADSETMMEKPGEEPKPIEQVAEKQVELPENVAPPEESQKILPVPEDIKPSIQMVLDTYQPDVKKAILATFNGQLQRAPVTAKREPMGKRIESKKANSPKGFDLLNALEKATGTGQGLPDSIPQSSSASTSTTGPGFESDSNTDFNSMSKEERRALLREK
ncbi:MAG: hypothetical protein KDD62_01865, partial [Bdellovibrionales bacterium]|nr:hypothetical protein [Bdellovibrionales bacterium]